MLPHSFKFFDLSVQMGREQPRMRPSLTFAKIYCKTLLWFRQIVSAITAPRKRYTLTLAAQNLAKTNRRRCSIKNLPCTAQKHTASEMPLCLQTGTEWASRKCNHCTLRRTVESATKGREFRGGGKCFIALKPRQWVSSGERSGLHRYPPTEIRGLQGSRPRRVLKFSTSYPQLGSHQCLVQIELSNLHIKKQTTTAKS